MKDTHSGAWAVMAVVLVLLIKFAALSALVKQGAVAPLLGAPLLGRSLLLWLFAVTPYVRPQGLGQHFSQHLDAGDARAMLVVIVLGLLLFTGGMGLILLLSAALAYWLLRRWMLRVLGGTTGDTAGALVEISEATMLVAAAQWVRRG